MKKEPARSPPEPAKQSQKRVLPIEVSRSQFPVQIQFDPLVKVKAEVVSWATLKAALTTHHTHQPRDWGINE